jgi:hypothetical protein
MPRFQLQSPNGLNSTITSSDPELIGRWFVETMRRDAEFFPTYEQWQLQVWPLFIPQEQGQSSPDWCADATHGNHRVVLFKNSLDGLIGALNEIKESGHL